MSFAETSGKVWHFLWEEDSLLSWVVNIVLAFVLVKFVIYPALGFALGTGFPIVAVVSGSMEHDGSFDSWWSSYSSWYEPNNISRSEFSNFDFVNGFDKGDIMLLYGTKPENIKVGDVVVYASSRNFPPIIHRVVLKEKVNNKYSFQTKGDHNRQPDAELVSEERVLGRAVFKVPLLGWVKIWFTDLVNVIDGG